MCLRGCWEGTELVREFSRTSVSSRTALFLSSLSSLSFFFFFLTGAQNIICKGVKKGPAAKKIENHRGT